jgi:hypothetical protein
MFGKDECKKLYNRSGHRGYCVFLAFALLAVFAFYPGCAHKQNCLKAVVSGGESLEFKRSFVKYVNIENDDRGHTRLAVIYLTDEGKDAFYRVVKGNVGKHVSTYFGDMPIIPDLYIAEPTTTERLGFILENAKDEALAIEIIKAYPGFKTRQ